MLDEKTGTRNCQTGEDKLPIDIAPIEKFYHRKLTNKEKIKLKISYDKNGGAIDIDEVFN